MLVSCKSVPLPGSLPRTRGRRGFCAALALTALVSGGCLADDGEFEELDETGETADGDTGQTQQASSTAPSTSQLVNLHTWYSPSRDDYFTTSDSRWQGSPGQTRTPDYEYVRLEGRAWRPDVQQPPDTEALHGWWNPTQGDNMLIGGTRYNSWLRSSGFVHVRVEGYVPNKPLAGTVRLRSLYGPDFAVTADAMWQSTHRSWRTEGHLFRATSWQEQPSPAPELFGYKRGEAIGTRPLLVIWRHLPTPSTAADGSNTLAFYDKMVFGPGAKTIPGYFRANSYGKFSFTRAGAIEITANSDQTTSASAIIDAAKAGFDFDSYDANGDGIVTVSELGILVITEDGGVSGQTTGAACVWPPGNLVQVCEFVSFVSGRVNFATIAHELSHQLGTLDIYGPDGQWSRNASLLAGTARNSDNDTQSFHMDPWHKMALGWIEPRIRSLREPADLETLFTPGAYGTYPYQQKRPVLLYDPDRGTNEFFLLEHRRPDGSYDANVADSGLALWHVRLDPNELRPADVRWDVDGDGKLEHRLANQIYNAPNGQLKSGVADFWDASHRDIRLYWDNGQSAADTILRVGPAVTGSRSLAVQIGSNNVFRARIDASRPLDLYHGSETTLRGVFGHPGEHGVYLRRSGGETFMPTTRWDSEGTLRFDVPSNLATGNYDLVVGRRGSTLTSNVVPVTVHAAPSFGWFDPGYIRF